MSKSIGLAQHHKKYLEVALFSKNTPRAPLFYIQAQSFYKIFKQAFGSGFITILKSKIANIDHLHAILTNYHFAVECLLKALICLKHPSFEEKTHDLIMLLEQAESHYPNLSTLDEGHRLLLRELGFYFNTIRYVEGTVSLSHNKKSGWKTKAPLEELSTMLDNIFEHLDKTYEKEHKSTKPKTK